MIIACLHCIFLIQLKNRAILTLSIMYPLYTIIVITKWIYSMLSLMITIIFTLYAFLHTLTVVIDFCILVLIVHVNNYCVYS